MIVKPAPGGRSAGGILAARTIGKEVLERAPESPSMQVNRLGRWLGWRLAAAMLLAAIAAYAVSTLLLARGIEAISPGPVSAEREAVVHTLALSSGGIAILSLGGLSWLVRRKVLARLHVYATLAREHARPDGARTRWPVQGDDEIDVLGSALNQMLDRIGERDRALAHLASHDPLTALGNRHQLIERLQATTALLASNPALKGCLVLADLDKLKAVNDVFGHRAGDHVLTVVAERIQALLRGDDIAVRLGGDEFAVLLADTQPEHALAYCERLAERLTQAIVFEDQFLFITASIGIACLAPGLNAHALLSRADLAMGRAKRSGGDRIVVFDPDQDRPRSRGDKPAAMLAQMPPDAGSAR